MRLNYSTRSAGTQQATTQSSRELFTQALKKALPNMRFAPSGSNRAHAHVEMPHFAKESLQQAAKKGPLMSAGYKRALAARGTLARTQGLDATFAKHKVDAIVAPTQGPPGLIDLVNGESGGGSSTSPCAVAGYPAITVPMGYFCGLPLGLTFMGRAFAEPTILRLAFAYEQATMHRIPPRYSPTAVLNS